EGSAVPRIEASQPSADRADRNVGCAALSRPQRKTEAQDSLRGHGQGITTLGNARTPDRDPGRNRRVATIRSRTICRRHKLLAVGHYEGDPERDEATARLLDPAMRNLALGASKGSIPSPRRHRKRAQTAERRRYGLPYVPAPLRRTDRGAARQ